MNAVNGVTEVLNLCCIHCFLHKTTEKEREARSGECAGHTVGQNVKVAQSK